MYDGDSRKGFRDRKWILRELVPKRSSGKLKGTDSRSQVQGTRGSSSERFQPFQGYNGILNPLVQFR